MSEYSENDIKNIIAESYKRGQQNQMRANEKEDWRDGHEHGSFTSPPPGADPKRSVMGISNDQTLRAEWDRLKSEVTDDYKKQGGRL